MLDELAPPPDQLVYESDGYFKVDIDATGADDRFRLAIFGKPSPDLMLGMKMPQVVNSPGPALE